MVVSREWLNVVCTVPRIPSTGPVMGGRQFMFAVISCQRPHQVWITLCVSCLGPAAISARQISECFFRVSVDLCEDQNQSADMDGEDVESADCQDHRP